MAQTFADKVVAAFERTIKEDSDALVAMGVVVALTEAIEASSGPSRSRPALFLPFSFLSAGDESFEFG